MDFSYSSKDVFYVSPITSPLETKDVPPFLTRNDALIWKGCCPWRNLSIFPKGERERERERKKPF